MTENPELYKEQLHLHETDKDFPGNKKSWCLYDYFANINLNNKIKIDFKKSWLDLPVKKGKMKKEKWTRTYLL